MRSLLGFSLLLLSLAAATYDGFRERERVRTVSPSSGATVEDGTVHAAEGMPGNPPR